MGRFCGMWGRGNNYEKSKQKIGRKSKKLKTKLKTSRRLLEKVRGDNKIPQLLNKKSKKVGQNKNKKWGQTATFGVYKKNDFKIFRNVMEQIEK